MHCHLPQPACRKCATVNQPYIRCRPQSCKNKTEQRKDNDQLSFCQSASSFTISYLLHFFPITQNFVLTQHCLHALVLCACVGMTVGEFLFVGV